MLRLILSLVRPYRGTLAIILLAMIVQTAMSVAGPWPLKIILDNVVGSHKLAPWLADLLRPVLGGDNKMQIAVAALQTRWMSPPSRPRLSTSTTSETAAKTMVTVTKAGKLSRAIA